MAKKIVVEKCNILCSQCIAAIRSRGEKIFVGELIEQDEDLVDGKWITSDKIKCIWCNLPNVELYECKW